MTSTSTSLVLAVDGGGTKTDLAFADRRGEIVFRAQGASSNPMDNAEWRRELDRLWSLRLPRSCRRPRTLYSAFPASAKCDVSTN